MPPITKHECKALLYGVKEAVRVNENRNGDKCKVFKKLDGLNGCLECLVLVTKEYLLTWLDLFDVV